MTQVRDVGDPVGLPVDQLDSQNRVEIVDRVKESGF